MRILAMLGLIILSAIGWQYFHRQDQKQMVRTEAAVVAYTLSQKPLIHTIEALGTTAASQAINVTVTVSDVINALPLQEGQRVSAGTILAELNKNEELALLSGANIELNQQRREYYRIEELVRKKTIPSSELDTRQSNIDAANARIAEITARIDDRTIRAPFSGIVGLRNYSVGAFVKPGDIITTLDATEELHIDFELAEKYLTQISIGKTLEAYTSAYPDQKFNAKVSTLDTRINPITRSIKIRAVVDNSHYALRPGMLMTLKLLDAEKLALLAPEEAVFMRADQHYVFVISADNTIIERKITIGARNKGWVEIVDGISEGEQIVHQGLLKVGHGSKVKMQTEDWRSENQQ